MESRAAQEFFFYTLAAACTLLLCVYAYKYSRLLFWISFVLAIPVISLTIFCRYSLLPVATYRGLLVQKQRFGSMLAVETLEKLTYLHASLAADADEEFNKHWPDMRPSLSHVYEIYAALYLFQNTSLYKSIPIRFREIYIELKIMLTCMSRVHLPIDKPRAVRIVIFEDIFPPLRKAFEYHDLHKLVWPATQAPDKHIDMLSALMNVNKSTITDDELRQAIHRMSQSKDFKDIIAICAKLMSIVKQYTSKRLTFSEALLLRRNPTFGDTNFLKAYATFSFMAKRETVRVEKNFPARDSYIDAMLVPNTYVKNAVEKEQCQLTDFNPAGKSMTQLVSMLYGTDAYERLYGEGYEQRFAHHPMAMIFNGNSECYEFRSVLRTRLLYHVKQGHNVYLFNYPRTADSSGDTHLSSIIQDCIHIAKDLISRFYEQLPGKSEFKLGIDGFSLGALIAIKTATALQKVYPAELLPFIIARKTFADTTDIAYVRARLIGYLFMRFIGASYGTFSDFANLKGLKINILDIVDHTVPTGISLSGIALSEVFRHEKRSLAPLVKDLRQAMHKLVKWKDRDQLLEPLYNALCGFNSAGENLNDYAKRKGVHRSRKDVWENSFVYRMVAYGSTPMSTLVSTSQSDDSIFSFMDLVVGAGLPGFSIVTEEGKRYLRMPQTVAALFNMFLIGSGNVEAKGRIHERFVIRPSTHESSNEGSNTPPTHTGDNNEETSVTFMLRWPEKRETTPEDVDFTVTIVNLLKRDMAVFGLNGNLIDQFRHFAWHHIHCLWQLANLSVRAMEVKSHYPEIHSKIQKLTNAIYNLSFMDPVDSRDIGPPDPSMPLANSVFHRRYAIFGNIITTREGHSIPLLKKDSDIITALIASTGNRNQFQP
ncbi:hypothetical protein BgAZ_403170 [Babesia gibsoni]|uniref:Uncharacterized protein n=1 Tax=Babesia gibsoni TaxID=33632 RepID=A0AAD8LQ25_BABGI|nr:hypothetical protein BgAZ_403170 [Babesia gibsoni]